MKNKENFHQWGKIKLFIGDMKMTQWKNGIAKITLPTPYAVGDVNVYVIKGDRLTLVDVGPKTPEAWTSLNEQLKQLHLEPRDIEQIVLTHDHPDHSGMLDYFSESLDVYGHHLNDRWLTHPDSFLHEIERFYKDLFIEFGIPEQYLLFLKGMRKLVDEYCTRSLTGYLAEGDSPFGLPDWKVVETPGHAQSHIGLYREKDGVYIGGDQLLAHISPNPLIEPPLPGETIRPKSLLQYNKSLRKMLEIPIHFVYSGHGEEVYHPHELILKRLGQQHERALKIKGWLEKDSLTVFEACQQLFPKVYQRQFHLTISETAAQFDYLDDLQEIKMNNEAGVFRYYA